MVRFSCFAAPIHHHRPKKVIQQPDRAMHSTSQVAYEDQVVMTSNGSAMANPKMEDNNPSNTSVDQVTSPSSLWKSEDLNDSLSFEDGKDFLQMVHLKKSQSLGCILEQGRSFSFEDASVDGEMDQRFPFSNSHDKDMQKMTDSVKNSASADPYAPGNSHGDKAMNLDHQENDILESFDFNANHAHHHSLFSIGVLKQFDGERLDVAGEKSGDHVAESGCRSFEMLPTLARSRSLINIRAYSDNTTKGAHTHEFMGPRSRSFGDFSLLYRERDRFQNRDEALFSGQTFHMPRAASYSFDMSKALNSDGKGLAGPADTVEECKKSGGCNEAVNQDGDGLSWREKVKYGNQSVDGDDSHSYCGLVNGWRQSKTSNLEIRGDLQQGIIIQNDDELTSKEFTKKRIEEWISQIDIENSFSLEEHVESSKSVGESSKSVRKKDPHIVTDETSAKAEGKSSPGMEAAYNYVSSLTAASSSAQMANLGLAVIPFLGAFVSLRVLNLSGNSIVRITAGALPKGLHMLNLSKNNISTIEGFRELTRLRMLDLSYNRISRISHGLASCSSLKELYLAGNKISEVEGLHRLLKLNILDLRFNKISTSKGLGQLAANYMSLQAINLEGNPAQRNVGDDQLKKYLVSLLPNLVYFNKQTIRSVSTKEVPDRSTRSITAHKLDHGMRSEHKHSRRVAHGASLHKSAASSSHGRSTHAVSSSVKQSQSRHGHLPPAGSKVVNHLPNISSTLSSLDPNNAIRRIRSECTL